MDGQQRLHATADRQICPRNGLLIYQSGSSRSGSPVPTPVPCEVGAGGCCADWTSPGVLPP